MSHTINITSPILLIYHCIIIDNFIWINATLDKCLIEWGKIDFALLCQISGKISLTLLTIARDDICKMVKITTLNKQVCSRCCNKRFARTGTGIHQHHINVGIPNGITKNSLFFTELNAIKTILIRISNLLHRDISRNLSLSHILQLSLN